MSVVLIARADQTQVLKKRLDAGSCAAVFADSEALQALDAILRQPPRLVALGRAFVASPRGAALVARLKTTPALRSTDVRVLAEDAASLPLILNARNPCHEGELRNASHPIDYWGTRRAPRFTVAGDAGIRVNGEPGQVVNLSSTGAQVVGPTRLRPGDALRVALVDSAAELKLKATVAWSALVPLGGAIAYRAGLEFLESDPVTIETFCVRHFAAPDRAYGAP
jgi:hypothetical protein